MTPTEALHILDVATGRVPATRDEHVAIVTALNTIKAAVAPPDMTGPQSAP